MEEVVQLKLQEQGTSGDRPLIDIGFFSSAEELKQAISGQYKGISLRIVFLGFKRFLRKSYFFF